MPYSSHTSATDAMSSMMPKLVVPAVATTAKKVSGSLSCNTFRRFSPVSCQLSSGTFTSSASITLQAVAIEECEP